MKKLSRGFRKGVIISYNGKLYKALEDDSGKWASILFLNLSTMERAFLFRNEVVGCKIIKSGTETFDDEIGLTEMLI